MRTTHRRCWSGRWRVGCSGGNCNRLVPQRRCHLRASAVSSCPHLGSIMIAAGSAWAVLHEGGPAPDFSLRSDTGELVTLSSLRGRPSSSTSIPRTTRPAARHRRAGSATPGASSSGRRGGPRGQSRRRGVACQVQGEVRPPLRPPPGHRPQGRRRVRRLGREDVAGKTYKGVLRSTFVIDAEGNVAKELRDVKPATHADDVLAALSS